MSITEAPHHREPEHAEDRKPQTEETQPEGEDDVAQSAPAMPDARSGLRRVAAISASLVGTYALTSVLGLAFWLLAARQFSVGAVGIGGAAISLMTLLGTLGTCGLGTLLIARFPQTEQGRRRVLTRTALLVAGGVATALAVVVPFVAIEVLHVGNLDLIAGGPSNALIFAIGTGLMAVALVVDQAVLVLGSGSLQLERNAIASGVKLAALAGLAVAGQSGGMTIFLAWGIGTLASFPLVALRTRGGCACSTAGSSGWPPTRSPCRRRPPSGSAGGVSRDHRITVADNGIDFEALAFDAGARRRVRAELGLAETTHVIGAVGRLDPVKRMDAILRATAPALHAGAVLVVAGTGPLLSTLQGVAADLGISGSVHWLGPRGDVAAVLSAVDVLVSASADETFGMAVVEAIGSGLPVVYVEAPALDRWPVPTVLTQRYGAQAAAGRVDDVYASLVSRPGSESRA